MCCHGTSPYDTSLQWKSFFFFQIPTLPFRLTLTHSAVVLALSNSVETNSAFAVVAIAAVVVFFFVIFISYCFFVCRLCSKYFFFIPPIWYFTERVNRIFFFCDFLYVYIILSFGNGILVLVWVCATIEWIKKKMRVKKHAVQSLPQPTQMHN